jgi:predicted enzyme related to lactoylglutathione lyase
MPTRDDAWPQGTPCWIDVQADDTSAARDFYSTLFGWEINDAPEEAGGYLMALLNGRPAAGIGPKPEGMAAPSVWTTYLAADNADDIHAKVAAAGGTAFMDPFDVLNFGRMFVAADPTGAVFGVWQAGVHNGMGVYNEPGACVWNELQTRDFDRGRDFYSAVFGYTYADVGDGQSMRYAMFSLRGALPDESVGGVNDLALMPGETPSHWLNWFAVDDCDRVLAHGLELGATEMMPAFNGPPGRMAILADREGAPFGIIGPSTAAQQPT